MEDEHEMSSLRSRLKKSSMSLTSCFNGSQHRRGFSLDASSSSSSMPSPRRPSSIWIRSKPNEHMDIKGKCKNFISRRQRRHASADFSYDPLSYALNFEDANQVANADEELPIRNFSARLPASPPRASKMTLAPTTPRSPTETCRLSKSLEVSHMKKRMDEVANARAAAVAEVRKSLEEQSSQVSVSHSSVSVSHSSREILVELC